MRGVPLDWRAQELRRQRPDRFATTWAEISVGCEACHGQGSRHAAWARDQQSWWPFGKRDDPSKGLLGALRRARGCRLADRSADRNGSAPSRRRAAQGGRDLRAVPRAARRFPEDWVPGQWLSQHACGLAAAAQDLSSGRTDPRRGGLQLRRSSRAGCSPRASPAATATSRTARSFAPPEKASACNAMRPTNTLMRNIVTTRAPSPPPTCMSCHMQTRTYMIVDPRHDHTFRIPRPDLSVKLGTPNACNDCHARQVRAMGRRRGRGLVRPRPQGFPELWDRVPCRMDRPGRRRSASCRRCGGSQRAGGCARQRADRAWSAPFAREHRARRGAGLPIPTRWYGSARSTCWRIYRPPSSGRWSSPLLSDPVRGVRIRAASLLAAVPTASQPPPIASASISAAKEFVAAQRSNADRPEARATLGNFLARRGLDSRRRDRIQGRPAAQPAICDRRRSIWPISIGSSAAMPKERRALRGAIAVSPRDAAAHHALGLALTRLKQPDAALAEFRRATELEPDRARYAYVYAVALHSGGRSGEAMTVLKETLKSHPGDRDILQALVSFSRTAGDASSRARLRGTTQRHHAGRPEFSRAY